MKTAMQWLDEQIKEKMGLDEHDTNQLKWFIDKALEKEKEQIKFSFNWGRDKTYKYKVEDEAEVFYKEAYQNL